MFSRSRRRLPDLVRSTVALHLVGGRTVAGVLISEYDDVVSLTNARVETSEGVFQEAAGEVCVPLTRIEWTQFGIRLDDVPLTAGELRALPARGTQGTTLDAKAG